MHKKYRHLKHMRQKEKNTIQNTIYTFGILLKWFISSFTSDKNSNRKNTNKIAVAKNIRG